MFSLEIPCFLFGIGFALSDTRNGEQDCVTRSELESHLERLAESRLEEISGFKQAHLEEISALKRTMHILEQKVAMLANPSEIIDDTGAMNDVDITEGKMPMKTGDKGNQNSERFGHGNTVLQNVKNCKEIPCIAELTAGLTVKTKERKRDGPEKDVHQRYLVDTLDVSFVAFSVFLNESGLGGIGKSQIIRYHKILTNVGNGFDIRVGVFTAPVSGIYAFSLTLMTQPKESQEFWVMRDGYKMFHVLATGNTFNTASKTVVFEVRKGQEVWVQKTDRSWASSNSHGDEHTSFTGFLLYAIDD